MITIGITKKYCLITTAFYSKIYVWHEVWQQGAKRKGRFAARFCSSKILQQIYQPDQANALSNLSSSQEAWHLVFSASESSVAAAAADDVDDVAAATDDVVVLSLP